MYRDHDAEQEIDPVAVRVLLAVPELAPRYLALSEALDDDPGGVAVLSELADLVTECLGPLTEGAPVLERAFTVVESLAVSEPDPTELVGWAFLDSLSPDELAQSRPWLGPATRQLLDSLDDAGNGG
jgi:hypothetical protein